MVYRTKNIKKEKLKRKLKKLFFRKFLPLFILFIISIFLWNASFLKINNIEISGEDYVSYEEIKSIFEEEVATRYFKIYSKNNIFFYPETKIKEKVLKDLKRVDDLKISYQNLFKRNLVLKIKEKVPVFLYCLDNSKEKCYFMENNGEIFTKYNKEKTKKKKEDFLIFQKINPEGKSIYFLQEKDFTKLKSFILDLESLGLKIKKVIINKKNEILLKTDSNATIIIILKQDYNKAVESLRKISFKEILSINKIKKDFKNNISYINLSFGGTIYYCVKGEACENNFK